MNFVIREITPEETWPLRHKVLWSDQPFEYVKLDEDFSGKHYACLVDDRIVTIVSLFINDRDIQFRKLATDFSEQGKGYGTKLMHHIMEFAQSTGAARIWCNARVEKSSFYERFGMRTTDHTFIKEGIDYVIMERVF